MKCFSRKISFRKTNSPRIGRIPIRLKDSNLLLKNSQAQSFSRNTDGQGICEQAEAFEGFLRPEGEADRDDEHFVYAAVWEYKGENEVPELTKEPLNFEFVHLAKRNYKD